MKPLSPEEVKDKRIKRVFPDFVLEAFNSLLLEASCSGGLSLKIIQDDAIDRILSRRPEFTRADIFNNKWLDVEDVYREAGWAVGYYKASIGESFSSYFRFSPKGGDK